MPYYNWIDKIEVGDRYFWSHTAKNYSNQIKWIIWIANNMEIVQYSFIDNSKRNEIYRWCFFLLLFFQSPTSNKRYTQATKNWFLSFVILFGGASSCLNKTIGDSFFVLFLCFACWNSRPSDCIQDMTVSRNGNFEFCRGSRTPMRLSIIWMECDIERKQSVCVLDIAYIYSMHVCIKGHR